MTGACESGGRGYASGAVSLQSFFGFSKRMSPLCNTHKKPGRDCDWPQSLSRDHRVEHSHLKKMLSQMSRC